MTAVDAGDTLTVSNAGSQEYTVLGTVALDDLVIGLADASGTADEVTVNVASDDDATATTLDDVEATSVETINLNLTAAQDIDGGNEVNVDTVSTTAAALVITGNADAALGGDNALTNTDINASAATGDLTIDLSAADQEVTGGSGDDTFNIGDNSTADDVIVGGAGNDTLNMTVASGVTGVVAKADVETVSAVVSVTGSGNGAQDTITSTVDASNITSVDALEVSANVTDSSENAPDNDLLNVAVTGVTSAVGTVKLDGDFEDAANDTVDVSIALDDATGTSDSLNITLNGGHDEDATPDEAVTQTVSGLTADDIESITLTMDEGDDEGVTTITDLTLTDATSLTATGSGALITTNAATSAVDTVDLSALTGGFDLAGLGSGATFKLGAIADGENGNNIDTDEFGGNDDAFSSLTLTAGEQDTIEFTDLSNSLVINTVEGGGDISDDDFDFSAMGISFSDLTFTDGDWDADNGGTADDIRISSAEFDGDIYIIGSTSADLNQVDFIF